MIRTVFFPHTHYQHTKVPTNLAYRPWSYFWTHCPPVSIPPLHSGPHQIRCANHPFCCINDCDPQPATARRSSTEWCCPTQCVSLFRGQQFFNIVVAIQGCGWQTMVWFVVKLTPFVHLFNRPLSTSNAKTSLVVPPPPGVGGPNITFCRVHSPSATLQSKKKGGCVLWSEFFT